MSAAVAMLRPMRIAPWAMAAAVAFPVAACAKGASIGSPPAAAPGVTSSAVDGVMVTVGGGFWSPRLAAVARASARCGTGVRAASAPLTERALFDALVSLSLDGASLGTDVPATCGTSCARPAWTGEDPRGCASLASLASLKDMIWRVERGEAPTVTVALIADSDLSFTAGGVRWRIEQGTDYPWSSNVGFTLSHAEPEDRGAPVQPGADPAQPAPSTGRELELKLRLPEWIDAASVRVSAHGRMLASGDYAIDGQTLTVRGPWTDGDRMHLSFPMPPRRVPVEGGVAIWRGPLRYVAEAADQRGGALADTTIAPEDRLRDVPFVLGAIAPDGSGAAGRGADPQGPTPDPGDGSSAAPNGIMAVMVERRARSLPDLVLVPLAFAGNRGDMPRVGTFAVPAP